MLKQVFICNMPEILSLLKKNHKTKTKNPVTQIQFVWKYLLHDKYICLWRLEETCSTLEQHYHLTTLSTLSIQNIKRKENFKF